MKTLTQMLFSKSFAIIGALLISILCLLSFSNAICAHEKHGHKKHVKVVNKKEFEKQFGNLREEYKYSIHHITEFLSDYITFCENLENQIEILEQRIIQQEKELIRVRNYIYRHTFNGDVLVPEFPEESGKIPVYIDGIRVDSPVYIDGIKVDRQAPGEDPY